jgi:hypothetical protein
LIMMCHTYNKNADSEYDSTNYAFLICEVWKFVQISEDTLFKRVCDHA